MSSGTSTDTRRRPDEAAGFEIWHFYLLVSMVAATAAVMLASNTHPVALLLLSAAVVAAGFVGITLHRALAGLTGDASGLRAPLSEDTRAGLEREKALTLRSIKELEFDRAMGKVSEQDFAEVLGRLRARAMSLIEELDRAGTEPKARGTTERKKPEKTPKKAEKKVEKKPEQKAETGSDEVSCAACQTLNDHDARFCKQCGAKL